MSESLSDKIKRLEEQKKTLVAEEQIVMRKALESDDPHAFIKANEFIQGVNSKSKASSKSYFLDPTALSARDGYLTAPSRITDGVLRNMAKAPIIKAIIETRVEQVSSFAAPQKDKYSTGFVIRKKGKYYNGDSEEKVTKQDEGKIHALTDFVLNCGVDNNKWHGDDFNSWLRKIVKDTLTLDRVTSEVIRNNRGFPIEYIATDASTFRLADTYDDNKTPLTGMDAISNKNWAKKNGYKPSYVQIYNNQIVADFYPWELMWGIRNPQTSIYANGYGESELETLIHTVTAMLQGDAYNANIFKVGAVPSGIFRVSGNINESRLKEFKQQWESSMAGYANCLSGSSVLWTKEYGNSDINRILENKDEEYVNVWVGDSYKKALVYKTGNKKAVKTTLYNGSRIITSPDHKFLAIDNNTGDPVWKKQSELKVDDYVLTNKKAISPEEKVFYNGKEVEEDLFEVMGWLTGDGYIDRGIQKLRKASMYYHPEKEQYILDRHLAVLHKYGINAKVIDVNRTQDQIDHIKKKYGFFSVSERYNYIIIADANFVSFLFEIGFNPSKYGKKVPYSMYMVESKNRCAFLRGLFSADGSMQQSVPSLAISHDDLRSDVRNLLLAEGIRCRFDEGNPRYERLTGKTKENGYRLSIKDRAEYFEKISFIQDYKKLNKTQIHYSYRNAPLVTISKYLSEAKKKVFEHLDKTGERLWAKYENAEATRVINRKEGRNLSHTKFISLLDAAKDVYEYPSWLTDYNLEQVVSIDEVGEEFMYDLEVLDDERHQFIADGVVVHNSHRTGFLEAEKMEFVDMTKSNRDMEFSKYQEYLIKLSCAIYKISPEEIGFSIQGSSDGGSLFESNNESKLKFSKDKGLKPILKFIEGLINKYLISPIDPDFEFEFAGLEAQTEEKELEMAMKKASSFKGLKEVRRERGLPDAIDEDDVILNPVYMQYLQMKQMGGAESNDFVNDLIDEENPMAKSFNEFVDKELIEK